jgi:2,4-dienoyl-CoA reductase-like NADH-dependent reductase (Old Yellow Enzyme family)
MHLIKTIITRIRKLAPPTFILCLKVNAADYVSNDISHDDALDQIKEMASWGGIDLIEISGGSYERPGL